MIFLFFLSGLVMAFNMSYLLPRLVQWLPMFWATLIALWLPLALIATYVLYRWRKSQKKFREYFMIGTMDKKLFLIVLGVFFLVQALELALAPTRGL